MLVLCFGTFDIFHEGHSFLLKKARSYGLVTVVLARNSTVQKVKGKNPYNNQSVRLKNVIKSSYVQRAVLGNKEDKHKIIEEVNPDIIVLGYDQIHFTEGLEKSLTKRGLDVKIVRLKESFKPDIYKSSLLRKDLEE